MPATGSLILRTLLYLRHGDGDPVTLADIWEETMQTDRAQEAALNEKLAGLTGAVSSLQGASDAILAFVTGLQTTVTGLQGTVADIQAKLDAALTDTVDLSDESAAIDAAKAQLDTTAAALRAAVPAPTPEPAPEA